jgi:metal-dependent amidase/aminoacylase/carboxypeptidase family protein
MSIQASAIIKGTTRANAPTVAVVHRIRHLAREAAERHPAEFGVQYMFQVEGDVSKPDFDNIRTGSFRKDEGQKEIQIAVPEILDVAPEEFLAKRLEDAFALAEQYFKRKHKGVSLDAARQATQEVVAQLRSRPDLKESTGRPE